MDVHETVLAGAGLESDLAARGRDLTALPERDAEAAVESDDAPDKFCEGETLVEYHGLPDRHLDAMRRKGFEDVSYRTRWLEGVALGGYFGYETFERFAEWGDAPYEDPQARLHALVDSLERREGIEEDGDLDDAVMQQLEDLGYA